MAVGATPLQCYEQENVSWVFTVVDPNIPNITGFALRMVIKLTAASVNPALLGPITASIVDTTHFGIDTKIDLAPGVYVYSVRRIDSGFDWQLAHGALTVLDSASKDLLP